MRVAFVSRSAEIQLLLIDLYYLSHPHLSFLLFVNLLSRLFFSSLIRAASGVMWLPQWVRGNVRGKGKDKPAQSQVRATKLHLNFSIFLFLHFFTPSFQFRSKVVGPKPGKNCQTSSCFLPFSISSLFCHQLLSRHLPPEERNV